MMATSNDIAKVKRDVPKASSLLSDTQIGQIFDETGGHFLTVAYIYDILAADASARGNIMVGRYKESNISLGDSYRMIATVWRRKAGKKGYVGGIDKEDVQERIDNPDRVDTLIKKQMDEGNLD
jgi:hypothetical protein